MHSTRLLNIKSSMISELQDIINYQFIDISKLKLALIHPSYANEHSLKKYETNQRLEFLGDAVLELVSSTFLYEKFTNFEEGRLTKLRAKLVCEESLSNVARQLSLYKFLLLGNGEGAEKVKNNNSIMCDTIEAIIGAIYLDSGIDNATKFIKDFILTTENINNNIYDYKTTIQEYANANNIDLVYELIKEAGPDHDKIFTFALKFNDKEVSRGKGRSKKDAEAVAAKKVVEKLNLLKEH